MFLATGFTDLRRGIDGLASIVQQQFELEPLNRAERSIKPFVMGRKNWLFSNTPGGAKSSAVDFAYDLGEHKSDDDLRASMDDALDDFFGNRQDCNIF